MTSSPSDHLPLHPLAFRVLMAVADGPSFGAEIVELIEAQERSARLYPANLYRRIRDLLAEGLLQECARPDGADPRRTYVQLTPLGRSVARAEALRLRALVTDARAVRLLEDT